VFILLLLYHTINNLSFIENMLVFVTFTKYQNIGSRVQRS